MNFLSKLFGGSSIPPAKAQSTTQDNHSTLADKSENTSRRQLVQVVLSDLLRRNGVKAEWIHCKTVSASSRTSGSGMYLRVVVTHWDERLMRYLYALQTEYMADISQVDPASANWLRGVSWQLDFEDSCPYEKMPDREFWSDHPTTPAPQSVCSSHARIPVEEPVSFEHNENAKDLEKHFAIRDREIREQAEQDITSVGYESTQPAPLER